MINKHHGLLRPLAGQKHFQLTRYPSSPDLRFFVERYWIVRWNLQEPYVSENIPYPCVNLVILPGHSSIFGVVTGKFSYFLEGAGQVFGIKFRPGAFYPFLKRPVSQITDTALPTRGVFGEDAAALESDILACEAADGRIQAADSFLLAHLPERDETINWINQIIDHIIAERTITRVEDIASRCHVSKRTLQRLFNQYVGVGPKWVIKRYRLHEAAERLSSGESLDWPQLASELGYFDQAHFIKDFKTIIGTTPAEYVRQLALEQ